MFKRRLIEPRLEIGGRPLCAGSGVMCRVIARIFPGRRKVILLWGVVGWLFGEYAVFAFASEQVML